MTKIYQALKGTYGASSRILKRVQYMPLTNASRQTPRQTRHGFCLCLPLSIAWNKPAQKLHRCTTPSTSFKELPFVSSKYTLTPTYTHLNAWAWRPCEHGKIWYGNGKVWCSGLFWIVLGSSKAGLLCPGYTLWACTSRSTLALIHKNRKYSTYCICVVDLLIFHTATGLFSYFWFIACCLTCGIYT